MPKQQGKRIEFYIPVEIPIKLFSSDAFLNGLCCNLLFFIYIVDMHEGGRVTDILHCLLIFFD